MTTRRIAFTTLHGPWGPFHVAATDRGVVAGEWLTTEASFLAGIGRRFAAEIAVDGPERDRLEAALPAIAGLLAGAPIDPSDVPVDLEDRPAWDRRVLTEVRADGWGEVASYGAIARRIGAPRAARAVGGALGRNPITLLIPCHRIIAADGTLGGYGGDGWGDRTERLALKRDLLLREGVTVATTTD